MNIRAHQTRYTLLLLLMVLAVPAGCGEQEGAAGTQEPPASAPQSLLSCAGGKTVSTAVDHDDSTKETRSPQEQAAAWAAAQAGAFAGEQKVARESAERVDITISDSSQRVTAVLTYHNDGDLGWRLEDALSCP